MKSFIFAYLFIFSQSLYAWDFNQDYVCQYQIDEPVTITIYGRTTPKFIVYASTKMPKPLQIEINDFSYNTVANIITIYGELPTPWPEGSTFEIEIRETVTSTFRIHSFSGVHESISMVCRPQ